MKYLVDIRLIALPENFRANIISKVNEFIVNRQDIWEPMWEVSEKRDMEGQMVLSIRVPFFEAAKRDEFREAMEAGVREEAWVESGVKSYLAVHNCDHDQAERHGCVANKFMEKT